MKKMRRKRLKKPLVSWWRKLLAVLISIVILISFGFRRLEVQWSKDQTAVIIKG
jgi:uncharacterized protein YpmS